MSTTEEDRLDAELLKRLLCNLGRELTDEELRICERCGYIEPTEAEKEAMGDVERAQKAIQFCEMMLSGEQIIIQLCLSCETTIYVKMKRVLVEEIPDKRPAPPPEPEEPPRNILL